MKRFFSYHPNDGLETHETADEARLRADTCREWDVDNSDEGVDEDELCRICWGEIREQVERTGTTTLEQAEAAGDEGMASRMKAHGWDFIGEWGLCPVSPDGPKKS